MRMRAGWMSNLDLIQDNLAASLLLRQGSPLSHSQGKDEHKLLLIITGGEETQLLYMPSYTAVALVSRCSWKSQIRAIINGVILSRWKRMLDHPLIAYICCKSKYSLQCEINRRSFNFDLDSENQLYAYEKRARYWCNWFCWTMWTLALCCLHPFLDLISLAMVARNYDHFKMVEFKVAFCSFLCVFLSTHFPLESFQIKTFCLLVW